MDADEAMDVLAQVVERAEGMQVDWCPHSPTSKQKEAYSHQHVLELLYGGAAGGGKSDFLLGGALRQVNTPGFAALILRRSYKDLSLPGAIMDRAAQWLRGTAAKWSEQEKTWTFPSGATLTFGYLATEVDKFQYQGAEFQYIAFDELTQFTSTQYTYLLSRLRRLSGSTVPLQMRSASNPGGRGHSWVYSRFVDPKTSGDRKFVPSLIQDNPHVDQDEYRKALAGLDEITRKQLEEGKWIQDSSGMVYKYDASRNAVPSLHPGREDWVFVLGVDLGTSEDKPTTAFCVQAYSPSLPNEVYTVESEKRRGMTPTTIANRIKALRSQYGGFQQILVDAGGLGGGYIKEFRTRHALPCEPAEKSNKLGYRKLLNGHLESGGFKVVAAGNEELVEELDALAWNDDGTDNEKGADNHISDAWLYSWRAARHWLAKEPESIPEAGTEEHARWEAEQMRIRHLAGIKERKRKERRYGSHARRY